MKHYLRLNETIKGEADQVIPASVSIQREDNILAKPEEWMVSIERFVLHGVRLPLFDPSRFPLVIGIQEASGTIHYDTVDFTGYKETDGYIYDLENVSDAITATLDSIGSGMGIASGDRPTFTFNDKTGFFSLNTNSTFRASFDVVFNDNMMWYWSTFLFETADDEFYRVRTNGDTETQDVKTLEFLSPVNRIVIETFDMPVEYELMPPVNGSISNQIAIFLTDYDYTQQSNQSLQKISYQSSLADHRYHNLLREDNFNRFNLNFVWYDFDGNKHQIYLLPQSSATVKIEFYRP